MDFLFLVFGCLVGLGVLVLPSPFFARQRPRCLINGCLGATRAVGAAEDLVVAEHHPDMRNESSIFRYGGAYLAYRSLTVRHLLVTLSVGGGGDNIRYVGGGDGNGDDGSDARFSSGSDAGDRIWGDIGDDGKDMDEDVNDGRPCVYLWHSSRRC